MDDVECICTNLRAAALAGTDFYDARLRPAGMKVTMFRLLRQIQRTSSPTLTKLADRMGLDRSTLGRNVRVLERQGLVAMSIAKDERSKELFLTTEGVAALNAAIPLWERAQEEMAAILGPETEKLIETLRTLSQISRPNNEKAGVNDQ
ncbi:MAG: winged helix-turn-helix transcriptional regulator [Boseongicola sp.]|nr:winged helix-turn-helix transcriptional regulator [Boseongicola sp.]